MFENFRSVDSKTNAGLISLKYYFILIGKENS